MTSPQTDDIRECRCREGCMIGPAVVFYVSSGIHMSVRTHDSQAEHCIFLTDLLKSKEISIYHVTKQRKEAHILAFANLNDL